MTKPVLGANIAALRKHLGLNQTDFADRVGAQQAYVSKWESKGMVPSTRPLSEMARIAGVSVADFMDKPWSPPEAKAVAPIAPDQPPSRSVDAGETVDIGKLDLSLSMGPGTLIGDYVEEETVSFDLALIRSITRSPPHRLKVVTGHGHSMEPTLQGSDMILIDTTDKQLARQDGIYWIDLFGAAGLKRLRTVAAGRVEIISDNPAVGNQTVDAGDLRIDGRAIWFARGL